MAELTLTTFLTLDGVMQAPGGFELGGWLVPHADEDTGNMVDEYRLLTIPGVLGTGKRLFGSGAVPANLKLVRSSTTGAGTVVGVYRRGGALQTGSFMLDDG